MNLCCGEAYFVPSNTINLAEPDIAHRPSTSCVHSKIEKRLSKSSKVNAGLDVRSQIEI